MNYIGCHDIMPQPDAVHIPLHVNLVKLLCVGIAWRSAGQRALEKSLAMWSDLQGGSEAEQLMLID